MLNSWVYRFAVCMPLAMAVNASAIAKHGFDFVVGVDGDFKAAIAKADPVLLEPIMKVDVTVPEDYMGDVIGDLNARRGRIEGMDHSEGAEEIHALVPLSEMFGYATALRSRTQGRGVYTMQPEHYEPVPKSIQEKVCGIKA